MTSYLAGVLYSALSFIFIVFAIGAFGYLIGAIKIKGIELGTAGVLLVALLWGVFINFVPSFSMGVSDGAKEIVLWSAKIKGNFSIVSNIGTALFVTAVGLIAGPKFFRSFNRATISYILLGVIIIAIGAGTAILLTVLDKDMSSSMAVGLLTGGLTSTPGFSAGKEVASAIEEDVTAGYGIA